MVLVVLPSAAQPAPSQREKPPQAASSEELQETLGYCNMLFPYNQYKTLVAGAEPTISATVYYPTGEEEFARWVLQSMSKASNLLTTLLGQPMPELQFLLAAPADWQLAPHEEPEELHNPHPYWTDTTSPPSMDEDCVALLVLRAGQAANLPVQPGEIVVRAWVDRAML